MQINKYLRVINQNINKITLNTGFKRKWYSLIAPRLTQGPERIEIHPIEVKCNHNCVMCGRLDIVNHHPTLKNDVMKLDDFTKLFSNLPLSVHHIGIVGGGEPLLHPQIIPILQSVKKNGFHAQLTTNAGLLTTQKIDEMIAMKLDEIIVSFHAASKDVYKKIHKSNEFDSILKHVEYILSHRKSNLQPHLILHFVIQKDNYFEIENFANLASRMNVDEITFSDLVPVMNQTLLTKIEVKKALVQLKHVHQNCKIRNNANLVFLRYQRCYDLTGKQNEIAPLVPNRFKDKKCVLTRIIIASNGDVFPCCHMVYKYIKVGNIYEKSIEDIWYGKASTNFRGMVGRGNFTQSCYKYCSFEMTDKNG